MIISSFAAVSCLWQLVLSIEVYLLLYVCFLLESLEALIDLRLLDISPTSAAAALLNEQNAWKEENLFSRSQQQKKNIIKQE